MTASNKIRIATPDTADAVKLACSEVSSAVGLAVHAEYQEIEGTCLILELRVGEQGVAPSSPRRMALAVDSAATGVEVLSSWSEPVTTSPTPRYSHDVLGVRFDTMPPLAQRALSDNLPTARWDRDDTSWHLAVPSACAAQPIVALSHRRGYTRRFTSLEAAAIRGGLAS
ncbi:MAG TPA: hypothetical protein VGL48_02910 [Acidimicrobiales bacterium]|jgi:hypothetical protein